MLFWHTSHRFLVGLFETEYTFNTDTLQLNQVVKDNEPSWFKMCVHVGLLWERQWQAVWYLDVFDHNGSSRRFVCGQYVIK